MLKLFILPTLTAVIGLAAILFIGGVPGLLLAIALVVLEVTLSFDNAVVNAKVLQEMDAVWQKRFLTWGILVSVFGTRLVLPIIIVAIVAFASPWTVIQLAIFSPEAYSAMLISADTAIKAFGGAFLLMVSLKYFFNTHKTVHWITSVEKRLAKWGRVQAVEIALALIALVAVSYISHESAEVILRSGLVGIILFIFTEGIAHGLGVESKDMVRAGGVMFIYLNVLDTAFSLDGVVGAFAITTSLPIIVVGLGVGAYFVRSLTVYFVRAKTLTTLMYLEHGAHWAVFALAGTMLVGLIIHIPEAVTAFIGLLFVGLAYMSSRKAIRNGTVIVDQH